MSEEIKEPEVKVEAPAQADATDWKAEARKWESRAKENKAAADRLHEIEESQKSEQQKLEEQLAEARARLGEFEKREAVARWAGEIVEGSHIPASALRGDTKEELEAHFVQLKSLVSEPKTETRFPSFAPEPQRPEHAHSDFVSRLFKGDA